MKVSIEWLKDYSDIDIDPKELSDILTLTGSKVEAVESKGNDIKNVVIGKILEIEKHPDADKLVVTKVDVGTEIIQIVTGANNIKVDDIVPIAKNGAELPGNIKIKTGKLRDIESCGMMCSIGELSLSMEMYPDQIEDGIMILPKELEKEIGNDVVDVLNLRDDIIEFEITSNRPDCFSVEGLGREVAVSLNKQFKNPHDKLDKLNIKNVDNINDLKVNILDPDLCYRYIARVAKNVKIGPSPEWMVKRLEASGVRSINNIVDITNYVMLELGQPMHAFDINSIEEKCINVRRANNDEKIITLDEIERCLDENMLVIADGKKPVAIAGVMGGLNSEIEDNTDTVVLESAVFHGGNVRKTAKKIGLRTEASGRYEKGLSSENALRAVNRAAQLIEELGVGDVIEEMIDVYPTKQKEVQIEFDADKINNLLGTKISEKEMIDICNRLEIKKEGNNVIPPYFRPDLNILADIAEEVLRFHGYNTLESTLINAESTVGAKKKKQKTEDCIRNLLVDRGLSEIYTFGFICENDLDKVNLSEENILRKEIVKIKNPLSEYYNIMRPTSIPSMMQSLSTNYNKKNSNVKLFDISRTYRNENGQIEEGKIPTEDLIITIGMYGEEIDFYMLKGIVENIFEVSGVLRYELENEKENTLYHPGRTAKMRIGKDIIATLGEAHPIVLDNYGISQRVVMAEINLDKLSKYGRQDKKYKEVAKYPAMQRDIAITVNEDIEVGEIEKIITKISKKALEQMKLFDIYRSEKLGQDKKSVAYALTFRANDRTMTDEEINKIMENIVFELEKNLGAELRK